MVFIFNLKLEPTATNRAHFQIKMDKRARYFLLVPILYCPITLSFFIVAVLFMSKFLCIIEKFRLLYKNITFQFRKTHKRLYFCTINKVFTP